MKTKIIGSKLLIGRAEWCALSHLGIPLIKAKIDTGAKTSAIHAFNIEHFTKNRIAYAKFNICPFQNNKKKVIKCQAAIIDERLITSSNGHKELRYVIQTDLFISNRQWPIELTLSNRDPLRYRLLLGREALNKKVMIDPALNCNQGK